MERSSNDLGPSMRENQENHEWLKEALIKGEMDKKH